MNVIRVLIKDGGMRDGCIGVLESAHGDWEFKVRFADGRFSYFFDNEFEIIKS